MFSLLCVPVVSPTPKPTITTQFCRMVIVKPTQKQGTVEVEIMDAPPINVTPKENID